MCAAGKGKAIAGATGPLSQRTRHTKEVIMLLPPPLQPIVEESAHSQLESFVMGTSILVQIYEPSTIVLTPIEPIPTNMGVDSL